MHILNIVNERDPHCPHDMVRRQHPIQHKLRHTQHTVCDAGPNGTDVLQGFKQDAQHTARTVR